MTAEYYIRQPDSEEARGPFNVHQMASLVDAGQVTQDTLYYDDAREAWLRVIDNEEMRKILFPEKKKLVLRAKTVDELNVLNRTDEGTPTEEVSVEKFLAAAEGDTSETGHYKKAEIMRQRAAALAIPMLGTMMIVVAISNILPSWDILQEVIDSSDVFLLIAKPLLVVGLLDLLIALCIFLGQTEIYPFLRFRAMAGFGYFGLTYWAYYKSGGNIHDLYAAYGAMIGSIGIFASTLTLNFYFLICCAMVGLAGAGAFGYFTFFASLMAGDPAEAPK